MILLTKFEPLLTRTGGAYPFLNSINGIQGTLLSRGDDSDIHDNIH